MKKYLSLSYSAIIYILIGAIPCSAELAPAKAPPAAAQKNIFFTFQVDAIANKDHAYVLEENLMDKGYPAYVEEASDNTGKITYQVRVGKYQTREDAEKAARAFYEKEKKSYWITATQLDPAESSTTSITAPAAERIAEPPQKELSSARSGKKEQRESPAVEKPSQQEKSLQLKSPPLPAAAEHKAWAAAVAPPAAAQPDSGWPPVVTRIYTYYDPQGYLRITNSAEKIPGELQNNIESVSIFPVKYLSFNQKKKVLALDIAGKQEELQLSGVDLDASAAVKNAAAYFEKTLKDVPLRLKYAPVYDGDAKKKIIWGTIFFKQGASLNIELVRQGIAPCDADSAPSSQKQAYREAEAVARSAKAGIWAEHAGAQ